MGKGDIKSRKGKIARGSYGVTRPSSPGKPAATPKAEVKTEAKPKA